MNADSWDMKVHFSKYLTKEEVVNAIIHTCTKPIKSIHSIRSTRMKWPTYSYEYKYKKLNPMGIKVNKKSPTVTYDETENDSLFETAVRLGSEYIIDHSQDKAFLLQQLEVSKILNG
jgi:hypothetical protein